MTIGELFRENKISRRSYHVCRANNIDTIIDLSNYYNKHLSFLRFKSCGDKSNIELINLLSLQKELHNGLQVEKLFNSLTVELTIKQKDLINSIIEILSKKLSERNKNALVFFFKDRLTIDEFITEVYENPNFKISKIENVGEGSVNELNFFFSTIKAISFVIKDYQ